MKIGLILPMTGPFASTGRQIEAAAKLYMPQNGDTVAGQEDRADRQGRHRRRRHDQAASRRSWSSTTRSASSPASA